MAPRTLLLAPPSVAAHPELLDNVYQIHDRSHADLQMLDRLAAGLVHLPPSAYDVVLLLTDSDAKLRGTPTPLGRDVINKVAQALKAGGILRSQDNTFGSIASADQTEAILAGLVSTDGGMLKPEQAESVSIPLKFGRKKAAAAAAAANGETNGLNGQNGHITNGNKRKEYTPEPSKPMGVGFVDFSDDLDDPIITGEDDDLIDEDDLITEEDMARPIIQPPECRPKSGKRRRACKDCSCGLKEKIEAEDAAKRSAADNALSALKLDADDLAEVDFTVQGKVGSCGNCALGDAFRCDGCPYIGLPAFKPGEEVRMLNNDVQL